MSNVRPFAVVTGASSGIGTAFARRAAREGYDVALVARRLERLKTLCAEITRGADVRAIAIDLDLARPGAAAAVMERIGGRDVDLLVNNAGYSIPNGFVHTKIEEQLNFLELMVTTPVALSRAVIPGMIARKAGRIINISSITAFSSGGKGHTLYPAAKSFLVKFSQSLSAELREKGIFVTAVCPGFVDTEFQAANEMAGKTPPPPKIMLQTPEQIVDESWRRNLAGAEVVVPGFLPKAAAAFLRYAPEQIVTPMTRKAAAAHYIGD